MKIISKILLTFAFVVISTVSSLHYFPIANAQTIQNSTQSYTNLAATTQDEKDDRPSDADDGPNSSGVGGDTSTATTEISQAARDWAKNNGFDLELMENYSSPEAHEPTDTDIEAFKNWMAGGSNPRNQVMSKITELAGEEIAEELWNYCNTLWKKLMNQANVGSVVSEASGLKNVGAMQEGMFAGVFGAMINSGGTEKAESKDNYSSALTLFTDGFVVSSDDVTYRLHNMIDGKTVYSMAAPKQVTVSEDKYPTGVTSFTSLFPLETHQPTAADIENLKQYAQDIASDNKSNEPEGTDRDVYEAVAKYINTEFGNYFGQCPGPTVAKGIEALGIELSSATEDKVGSSVGERDFVNSFFGVSSATANIWRAGFLPSFDGETYRLHSGKDGTVVYSATIDELNNFSADTQPAANSDLNLYITCAVSVFVIILLVCGLIIYKKRRKN